jgi:hypothetical protein
MENSNLESSTHPALDMNVFKCRFFGQYLEQIIAKETNSKSPTINVTRVLLTNDVSKYHLELKTLSKITDEDANSLIPFVSMNFSSRYTEEYIREQIKKDIIDVRNVSAKFYDILRSKGYALPFLGYSVEDLVSFGWVRLV